MDNRVENNYLKKELYELIKNDESIFDFIQESSLDGLWYWDLQNPENEWMNPKFWTVLGYNPDEMPHKASAWQDIINQDDLKVATESFSKHLDNPNYPYDQIIRYTHKNRSTVWIRCRGMAIRDIKGKPIRMLGAHQDITESKKTIESLKQIEWMLSEKKAKSENFISEYGDLSELNKNGLILSLVGKEQLQQIASEYLDLLETSSAIYEKNGDYAMGIFSSNWCQKMDTASRKLCNTNSNEEALNCGKWLCHESCWRDASLKVIESGKPADVECKGGIRLFAVPIQANGEVIGAINFGYGEPPKTESILQELSVLYQIPVEELRKARQDYKIRPQFIIDYAKKRILVSALYLGYLIEHKQAELLLQAKSKEITAQNEVLNQTNQELNFAKEKAEENEERYRLQFQNMNSYNSLYEVVTDTEGKAYDFRFIEVNHAYEDYVGKKASELIGKTLLEVYPATEQYWIDRMVEVAMTGEPCRLENFSTVLNAYTETSIYVPKQGQLAMTSTNITERKRAEEAQAEITQRLRLANKATNDVIWDWDVINDTQQWNEAGIKVFGWTEIVEHPVNAQWWLDRVHPEDRDRVHNTFFVVVNNSELDTWHNEYRFLKADGTYAYVMDRGYVLRDKNGKALRMIGAMLDISDKKMIEQKLILAKEKAEESDLLKTAFLQNMSHEIRTPMNAIMGFSSLLPKNFNNREKLESYSKIIELRCSDLLDIINDILDISKIESGQSTISLENCNLNELFDELGLFFRDYKERINKQHINVFFHPAVNDSSLAVKTDKVKLKQIIINLISNALKFTQSGSIECGYKQVDNKLQFYVSDTGIGIPADKHDFIFERFSQLKHPSLQNVGGTGLGLPIVKGLVGLLDGQIWLESECNKGSKFSFTIDYIKADLIKAKNSVIEDYQEIISDKTILIVEDDFYNAEYLKEVISNISSNIITVANGLSAVKIVQEKKIDIILMDIRLPDINGYEATKLILQDQPDIKIIAQTAYAENLEHQKAIDAGCVDYISKPIKQEQLLTILKNYLK